MEHRRAIGQEENTKVEYENGGKTLDMYFTYRLLLSYFLKSTGMHRLTCRQHDTIRRLFHATILLNLIASTQIYLRQKRFSVFDWESSTNLLSFQ